MKLLHSLKYLLNKYFNKKNKIIINVNEENRLKDFNELKYISERINFYHGIFLEFEEKRQNISKIFLKKSIEMYDIEFFPKILKYIENYTINKECIDEEIYELIYEIREFV